MKAEYAACGWVMAMEDRCSTSRTHVATLCCTYSSTKFLVPMAAPRCLFPSVVMDTPVFLKSSVASVRLCSLTMSHVLAGLGWYPYSGPILAMSSHQDLRSCSFPPVCTSHHVRTLCVRTCVRTCVHVRPPDCACANAVRILLTLLALEIRWFCSCLFLVQEMSQTEQESDR